MSNSRTLAWQGKKGAAHFFTRGCDLERSLRIAPNTPPLPVYLIERINRSKPCLTFAPQTVELKSASPINNQWPSTNIEVIDSQPDAFYLIINRLGEQSPRAALVPGRREGDEEVAGKTISNCLTEVFAVARGKRRLQCRFPVSRFVSRALIERRISSDVDALADRSRKSAT